MTLYELTGEMLQLQNLLEETPDDDSLTGSLDFVAYDLGEKVDDYVKVIRNMESKSDALANEKRILDEKKKHLDNSIARLKNTLYDALNTLEVDKVEGTLFTIKKRKNPAKLPELEIADVPKEYLVQQEPKIDKKSLLRDVKNGKVKGIELVQEESLMIR
jgi:hypothetical protein